MNPEKLAKAGGIRALIDGNWEWFFADTPQGVHITAREYGTMGTSVLIRFKVIGDKEKVTDLINSLTEGVIL